MKRFLTKVIIISLLMIASSVALNGVGYEGAEGVGMIIIHSVWFLVALSFGAKAELRGKIIEAHKMLKEELEKAKQTSDDNERRANVHLQLALDRIKGLEEQIAEMSAAAKRARRMRSMPMFETIDEKEARKLLNIRTHELLDKKLVVKAYNERIKSNHPDNGGDGRRINDYQRARDILLSKVIYNEKL